MAGLLHVISILFFPHPIVSDGVCGNADKERTEIVRGFSLICDGIDIGSFTQFYFINYTCGTMMRIIIYAGKDYNKCTHSTCKISTSDGGNMALLCVRSIAFVRAANQCI